MPPDPAADARFARLWQPLAARVDALVRRQCAGTGLHPDEIVQEVRLRLWKALGARFDEKDHAGLTLYARQAVVSAVVDALRARHRKAESALEDTPAELASSAPGPERMAAGGVALAAFRQALAQLPERRRQPVLLLLQGFAPDVIGRMLGLSADQARNLAYRGLETVRSVLREQGFGDGTEI